MLSKRALQLKPSPTLAMANRARELAAAGHDVVSLTVGEPDWPTMEAAKAAGIQAIQENFTKYTAAAGIPELKNAIIENILKDLGLRYTPAETAVGAGAKFVIFAALQMICDPGDEVLIPSPYWVSYPTMVELADGVPRIINCGKEQNFKLSAQQLEKHLTAKVKALILCSPSNPTGLSYTSDELKALGEVLKKHPNVLIISDDIYNSLYFGKTNVAPHLLHLFPEFKERTLVVNGASKAFSMTGWRIGWGLGPKALINAMSDYMSQSTSNPSSISQRAALGALRAGDSELLQMRQTLIDRKNWFLDEMKKVPGMKVVEPNGAFYFWTDVTEFMKLKGLKDSKEVSEFLLDKHHIATVPGIEFGCEGYIRMSFAVSKAQLQKVIDRLVTK